MKINPPSPKINAGLPFSKEAIVQLVDVDFIVKMPTVDEYGIRCIDDFEFLENAEFQLLYLTPTTQKPEIIAEGDVKSRFFRQKLTGFHPGSTVEMFEFLKQNLNIGFVGIYKNKNETFHRILGEINNPLFLMPSYKEDDKNKGFEFTLEQAAITRTPILFYQGIIPAAENQLPKDLLQISQGGFIDVTYDY